MNVIAEERERGEGEGRGREEERECVRGEVFGERFLKNLYIAHFIK